MERRTIGMDRGYAWNILGEERGLEATLGLGGESRWHPLTLTTNAYGQAFIGGMRSLFDTDPELDALEHAYAASGSRVFNRPHGRRAMHPHHRLLDMPYRLEDARLRQESVRELVENDDLYTAVETVLASSRAHYRDDIWEHPSQNSVRCDVTPESARSFIKDIASLAKHAPASAAFHTLMEWGSSLANEPFLERLSIARRAAAQPRFVVALGPHYGTSELRLLDPDADLDSISRVVDPNVASYTIEVRTRRETHEITRSIERYRSTEDKERTHAILADGRAWMRVVDEQAARMLAVPIHLMELQLKHLYQGAYLYRAFEDLGAPVSFPELTDEHVLELEELWPVRLALEDIATGRRSRLVSNSLALGVEDTYAASVGVNNAGKSELWRSVHLVSALANAGYPVPAEHAVTNVARSHFLSAKGESGRGGSELGRGLENVLAGLGSVGIGESVIIDEIGDATNEAVALETLRRIAPVLARNGSRLFTTSQYDPRPALGAAGVTLTPDLTG